MPFADFNQLIVTSTRFQHPKTHLLTWCFNDGRKTHHIDFTLVSSRWPSSAEDCRAYHGGVIRNVNCTDHIGTQSLQASHSNSKGNLTTSKSRRFQGYNSKQCQNPVQYITSEPTEIGEDGSIYKLWMEIKVSITSASL